MGPVVKTAAKGRPMKLRIWLGGLAFGASLLLAQTYTISSIAGGGALAFPVRAIDVRVPVAGGVATGRHGDVYFCTTNAVLKLDAKGILTRVAGTGKYGYSGDGGPATRAELAWPAGLAVDESGNLLIADSANHRIRKVSLEGNISTVAGSAVVGTNPGSAGDGGPATRAHLSWPTGVAVDATGHLYIADTGNQRIRKVLLDGTITTLAANLQHAESLAVDAVGRLYLTDYVLGREDDGDGDTYYQGRILRVTPDGLTETLAAGEGDEGWRRPRGIAVDALGNVIDADAAIYQTAKQIIIASLHGHPQPLVIEAARSGIDHANQPSFAEVFDGMRGR